MHKNNTASHSNFQSRLSKLSDIQLIQLEAYRTGVHFLIIYESYIMVMAHGRSTDLLRWQLMKNIHGWL